MTESQTQESGNTFYVIGLRVDPETEEANFYVVLMYSGDKSIPLLVDNQLAIFQRLSSVATAISKVDATKSEDDFESLEYGLDFAEALYLFQSEAIDSSATILNLMNLLSDIFDGLRVRVPSEYKDVLNALANHLTFEREFGTFIEQSHITRERCINGTLWCLGAVFANSRIII